MEFVDHVCEQYPAIDTARIGVTGGSYGGWMTTDHRPHGPVRGCRKPEELLQLAQ